MAVFFDNFERANGALGNGWTVNLQSMSISGGYVVAIGTAAAYNSGVSDSGKQESIAHCGYVDPNSLGAGPLVKTAAASASGYAARIRLTTGTYYLSTGTFSLGSFVEKASASLGTTTPFLWKLSIVYDGGTITATYNDSVTATFNDLTYSANTYAGFIATGANTRVADVTLIAGTAPQLNIAPDVVGNYNATTELTATGTGTAWSAGTPGTPAFTCDHGTIDAQQVLSATSATLTYNPGSYLGAVTFADPSTGATDTIIVTSDPGVVTPPGVGCQFCLTEGGAALINDSAAETALTKRLFSRNSTVGTSPIDVTYEETIKWLADFLIDHGWSTVGGSGDSLTKIANMLYGDYTPPTYTWTPPQAAPIKSDTLDLLTQISDMTADGSITLAQVINILRGSGPYDLTTITAAIAAGGDLSPVTDLLYSMWGTERPTLTQIATMLSDLATPAGYNLGDILDAIRGIPEPGQPPSGLTIAAVLAAIAALTAAVGALATVEAGDAAASAAANVGIIGLAAEVAGLATSVAEILTLLRDLQGGQPTGWYHPPVWPGLAHVTMGTPQDLQSSLVVPGPMSGVCVHITSTDPGTGFYDYDVDRCWRNIGAVSFVTDRGDHEHWQPLGFSSAMYVPKTIHEAASCKLHLGRHPRGTVTPWLIASP